MQFVKLSRLNFEVLSNYNAWLRLGVISVVQFSEIAFLILKFRFDFVLISQRLLFGTTWFLMGLKTTVLL